MVRELDRTRWTAADVGDHAGRTFLVTGANSGLGLRSAQRLAAAGALVLLACRDAAKADEAERSVAAGATGPAPRVVSLDLADLRSVREAASKVDQTVERLDGLVNNAGVMAVPRGLTRDGFELQIGTNHLGHFALTGLLLPALLRAPAPRVVTVSSIAHWPGRIRWNDLHWERRYSRWHAYSQSKLANLLFTAELDRRARTAGTALTAVAAHPGVADTNLYRGPAQGANPLWAIGGRVGRVLGQPDSVGVLAQLRALTDPDVQSGEYVGASGPRPGPFEFRGHPRRVTRSPRARSEASGRRLWAVSEESTGVTYCWPVRVTADSESGDAG